MAALPPMWRTRYGADLPKRIPPSRVSSVQTVYGGFGCSSRTTGGGDGGSPRSWPPHPLHCVSCRPSRPSPVSGHRAPALSEGVPESPNPTYLPLAGVRRGARAVDCRSPSPPAMGPWRPRSRCPVTSPWTWSAPAAPPSRGLSSYKTKMATNPGPLRRRELRVELGELGPDRRPPSRTRSNGSTRGGGGAAGGVVCGSGPHTASDPRTSKRMIQRSSPSAG